MSKRILVCGGDGFCGWPAALRLSARNHQVFILDNLSRRKISHELKTPPLIPISSPKKRTQVWNKNTSKKIEFIEADVCDLIELRKIIQRYQFDCILHLAEIRSAPYSMIDSNHQKKTIEKNLSSNQNLVLSIAETSPNTKLIHIGTMGVYGYEFKGVVPEGYLENQSLRSQGLKRVVFPPNPGSVYHLSKVLDHFLLQYYAKMHRIEIIELHQGIVWGTQISETLMAEDLLNRIDYDGEYGTVVNRFLIQSAAGHPLTLYGLGKQKRAFINLNDAVNCMVWAVEKKSPAKTKNYLEVYNQFSEIKTIDKIAETVRKLSGAEISHIKNPRIENEKNNFSSSNRIIKNLHNLQLMTEKKLATEIAFYLKYKNKIDEKLFISRASWK